MHQPRQNFFLWFLTLVIGHKSEVGVASSCVNAVTPEAVQRSLILRNCCEGVRETGLAKDGDSLATNSPRPKRVGTWSSRATILEGFLSFQVENGFDQEKELSIWRSDTLVGLRSGLDERMRGFEASNESLLVVLPLSFWSGTRYPGHNVGLIHASLRKWTIVIADYRRGSRPFSFPWVKEIMWPTLCCFF